MGRKNARPSRCFEGRAEKSARGSTLIGSLCRAIVQHTVRSGGGLPLPPNQRFSPNRASLDILRQDTLLRHLGRVQYSPIRRVCQGGFRQFFIHDFLCCRGNRACGHDKGAIETDKVCGRPFDPFARHFPCYLVCVVAWGNERHTN